MVKKIFHSILFVVIAQFSLAQGAYGYVKQGNKEMKQKKYTDAALPWV